MKLLSWLRRSSLATRLAILTGLFQIAVALFATAAVLMAGDWAVLQLWWSPRKILALLALFTATPLLVHRATWLWLERPTTRWPDIEKSWRAVTEDLGRQQVDLKEWPLFLVLGTDGDDIENALLTCSSAELIVSGSPGRGGPLHAYASNDAIFLCLSGIGETAPAAADCRDSRNQRTLKQTDRDSASRLATMCDLLQRERSPFVPINGILAVVPVELGCRSSNRTTRLGNAIAEDLHQLTRRLRVRAPATFLCTGLESETGLAEFFTILESRQQPRVNSDQTVSKPTGREDARGTSFPVGIWPTQEHVSAISANAAGPLTDEIAGFLLDPTQPAELWTRIRLLKMLCRLRLNAASQLIDLLNKVFAHDSTPENTPLLAGAFIGSLSSEPDRQGFLSGVLDGLVELQAELEWTGEQADGDIRASRAAKTLALYSVVIVIAAIAILWWKFVK